MNGRPVNACLVLAFEADNADILTIEGLADNAQLHPLQESFIKYGGLQCGFCTPGMIMVAKALLDRNPNPTEEEIRKTVAGNICRCTGYVKIVQSISEAAKLLRGEVAHE
jgi:carbon-monoxide dehydrogenase small subunit